MRKRKDKRPLLINPKIMEMSDDSGFMHIIRHFMRGRYARSNSIKKRIDIIRVAKLTKLQVANINTYLRSQGLLIRIAIKGNQCWEVWYK